MTQTITIEFTEQEVVDMVQGFHFPREIREKFEAALPPEYPEGTIAWVTQYGTSYGHRRKLAERQGDCWVIETKGPARLVEREIVKVEVIPTLADGELAVKRAGIFDSIDYLRDIVATLRRQDMNDSACVVDAYADALEKAGK